MVVAEVRSEYENREESWLRDCERINSQSSFFVARAFSLLYIHITSYPYHMNVFCVSVQTKIVKLEARAVIVFSYIFHPLCEIHTSTLTVSLYVRFFHVKTFCRSWIQRWTAPRSCVFMSNRIRGTFPAVSRRSHKPLLNLQKVSVSLSFSTTHKNTWYIHKYIYYSLLCSALWLVYTYSRVTCIIYNVGA